MKVAVVYIGITKQIYTNGEQQYNGRLRMHVCSLATPPLRSKNSAHPRSGRTVRCLLPVPVRLEGPTVDWSLLDISDGLLSPIILYLSTLMMEEKRPWLRRLVDVPPRKPGFDRTLVHVGFVVERLAFWKLISKYIGVSLSLSFYHCSIPAVPKLFGHGALFDLVNI
jgi:hypothetical protein